MQAENDPAAEPAPEVLASAAEGGQGDAQSVGGKSSNGSDSASQPASKKQKTSKEAEELLNAANSSVVGKTTESKVLQQTASDLLATFKQLARNPQDAQREDDDGKSALLEVLKLRHEYATHPEGWVARKKRITRETAQRWGVTDSGALCSRVGPNFQVNLPEFVGSGEYEPIEICTTSYLSTELSEEAVQAYLYSLEPLYKQYVLSRRAERTSYRDMGTFREFALEQLHAHKCDPAQATEAVSKAMQKPGGGWESGQCGYEVWSASQARSFKSGADKYNKNFAQIATKALADKPIKALISFYYRAKHVEGACRRGPVLLVSNSAAGELEDTVKEEGEAGSLPRGPEEAGSNNWLQMRCECRRWLRVNDHFRHLYQICPDCEKVLCTCPSCCTAVVLPTPPPKASDSSSGPNDVAYACPNCSHLL